MSSTPLVRLTDVRKEYHLEGKMLPVLRGVSLSVEPGEIVAITGRSGAGKSTLLQVMGGLDDATSGEVEVAGDRLDRMSAADLARFRNRTIGFVFQFHHLLPDFNAAENVTLPQLINGASHAEAQARAEYLLGQLGLSERLEHRPSKLSGGEQQRVAVARALANRPRLILADEPTGNLDEHTADIVLAEFMSLIREEGSAAVVATHNERLAAKMDRIVRLHDGVLT